MIREFFSNNYYFEQPVKFRFKPRKVDTLFRGISEVSKIFLIRNKLMEVVPNERLFERPFALSNMPKKEKLKILDLGCGDSIFPLELASLDHEVWGSDPKAFQFAKQIKFIKGDFIKEKDKFPKNYFDVIFCISAIEHFGLEIALGEKISNFDQNRKDIEAISICHTLLKKGGLLILTTPYGEKRRLESHERIYDEEEIKNLTNKFKLKDKRIISSKNKIIGDEVFHDSIYMGVFYK